MATLPRTFHWALINDLDGNLLPIALGNGLDDGADVLGNAALTADHLAHILGGHPQLQDSRLALHLSNGDGVGIVHEIFCHIEQKFLHTVVSFAAYSAPAFFSRALTVSVG